MDQTVNTLLWEEQMDSTSNSSGNSKEKKRPLVVTVEKKLDASTDGFVSFVKSTSKDLGEEHVKDIKSL